MIIAHLGHPWVAETLVLIRKHPHVYSDISALHYRPWQFYNSLILAKEYGVLDKILFGSDYPFTTPEAQIEGLRNINHFAEGTNLPVRLTEEQIEGLIDSPINAWDWKQHEDLLDGTSDRHGVAGHIRRLPGAATKRTIKDLGLVKIENSMRASRGMRISRRSRMWRKRLWTRRRKDR